ncbi:MAG: hypothetical protein ACP5O7_13190, partial [Phycisphaerae bacterium]
QTQGDWVGHYGRQYAVLFACDEPLNEMVCFSGAYYHVHEAMGPHHGRLDGLRAWLQWPDTHDARVLYDPVIGHRCEAEIDDHGESFPTTWRDLGIWIGLRIVPQGMQRISLYFFNKDGHSSPNRNRDYVVDVYPAALGFRRAIGVSPLAQARVVNFWGGVFESFAVRGPGYYLFRIRRNGSLNTILQALFIDRLSGPAIPSDTLGLSFLPHVNYAIPAASAPTKRLLRTFPSLGVAVAIDSLVGTRDGQGGSAALVHISRVMALRTAEADHAPRGMAARLRWELHLWTPADRAKFKNVCQAGWKNFLAENPQLKGRPPH